MKPFRVLLLVLLTFASLPGSGSASLMPLNAPMEFQNLLQQISTPKDLAKWMRRNFKFVEDKNLFGEADYWQSPEEFLRHKKGDCEDYALFAKSILDLMGVKESYVVSLYGSRGYAHTVVIYKEGNGYNIFNEDKIQKSKSETIEDAIAYLRPDWTWAGIVEKKGNRGRMIFSLENPRARF